MTPSKKNRRIDVETVDEAFTEFWKHVGGPDVDHDTLKHAFYAGMVSLNIVIGVNVERGMTVEAACEKLENELNTYIKGLVVCH